MYIDVFTEVLVLNLLESTIIGYKVPLVLNLEAVMVKDINYNLEMKLDL